jgi:hypothetical protein
MELTDRHLEVIRAVARSVDYGSVVINISASSDKLDLDIHRRMRIDKDADVLTIGRDVQKNGVVCHIEVMGKNAKRKA